MDSQCNQCIRDLFVARERLKNGLLESQLDELLTLLHEAADLLFMQTAVCPET